MFNPLDSPIIPLRSPFEKTTQSFPLTIKLKQLPELKHTRSTSNISVSPRLESQRLIEAIVRKNLHRGGRASLIARIEEGRNVEIVELFALGGSAHFVRATSPREATRREKEKEKEREVLTSHPVFAYVSLAIFNCEWTATCSLGCFPPLLFLLLPFAGIKISFVPTGTIKPSRWRSHAAGRRSSFARGRRRKMAACTCRVNETVVRYRFGDKWHRCQSLIARIDALANYSDQLEGASLPGIRVTVSFPTFFEAFLALSTRQALFCKLLF